MQVCPYKENKIGKCREDATFICEKDSADTCWIYYSKLLDKEKTKNSVLNQVMNDALDSLESLVKTSEATIIKVQEILDRVNHEG